MGAVAAAVAGGGGSGGGSRQRETVDPLAALTGGLGGLGGTRGEGLLADLLGGDDRASLKQAVEGGLRKICISLGGWGCERGETCLFGGLSMRLVWFGWWILP